MLFILLLVLGSGIYGLIKYHNLKNTVNSSYNPSGITKQRNINKQFKEKKPISILLLGTDTGAMGREYRGRTDSMMVATLNPQTKSSTITSIPRDTAINLPEYTKTPTKINSAYAFGQTKAAITTVQDLLNIPVDFYILIDFGGFKKIIDKVGGIDITPSQSFEWMDFNFIKGKNTHMNGDRALAYAGMRYSDPQGDYGRQRRQREVLMAIIKKSGSISTLLNQDFLDSMARQTQTDLTFDDLTAIAKDYRSVKQHVSENHLQGSSKYVADQSMEIIDKTELQRVTDQIRDSLDLPKDKTGNIAYYDNSNEDL